MSDISFGTDGWRAVIADEYTFEGVARVARATAQWLEDTRSGDDLQVALGHDARFLGRRFAEHAARVLAANDVKVHFGETLTSTPAVSNATVALGCDAGVVITASHNPPEYNGFKIKADFGGPGTPEMIAEVEARIPDDAPASSDLPRFDDLVDDGRVQLRDLTGEYLDALRGRLDLEAIRNSGFTIAHDAMFGAGKGMVRRLIGEERTVEVRHADNPGFEGTPPEPIESHLQPLQDAITREGCDAGIANDGDADRIGMVDENARYVTSHEILALLVKYLHEERGLSGDIVKTFSTTHMLDDMADAYGLSIETTPVGFKHIAPQMVERDVLVGGEESGGIAAAGHIPERDGIYIGLLVVEMMAERGETLSALVQELHDEFGPHYFHRDDIRTTDAQKAKVLDRLENKGGLQEVDGHAVQDLDTLDGYKHLLGDGSWLLVRPSGTEPVLRVYAESDAPESARALVEDAAEQLGLR